MRLIIILTVIIYWLLPVDIAPGPLDDIIVTVAGLIMAAAEKKRGEGVKNFLALVGIVALLIAGAALYAAVAPLLGGVDALTLTNAVTQQQQAPQTVYIVATPTLAPAAPVQVVSPPEPVAPTAVPPAAPTSAPSPITADEQFALDCAAGKAAGRRVSPLCPPMAAQPLTVTAPILAYCFQGDGWTPEYRATVAAGFDAWAATGIMFC